MRGKALTGDKTVSTKDIESLLVCIPGVQKARVVVNDWGAIKEIHILTGLDRSPKQIVRDVESALKAQWDINLDRRVVSVAQIKAKTPLSESRLRFVGFEVKTDTRRGKIEGRVSLEGGCEDHIMAYVGKAEGDIGSRSVMYTLARATCMAVNLAITPMNEFFVDDVTLVQIGQTDAVNVLVGLVGAGINSERLLGAALVRRSIEEACVRATLDAVNRRCEVIMENDSGSR